MSHDLELRRGDVRPSLAEKILYRGDATKIDQFDINKTNRNALLGAGIYLTDDPAIAADYTLKGSAHVLYTDPEAKTQRALIAGYINALIDVEISWPETKKQLTQDWATKNVKGHVPGAHLPGMSDGHWNRLDAFLGEHHKRLAAQHFPQAQAKLRQQMPNLKIARDTLGKLSIVTRERTGAIATFDVPESYFAQVLHAEQPMPDPVLKLLRKLWFQEMGKTGHGMRDGDEHEVNFDAYVKNFKTRGTRYAWRDEMIGGKGVNPSFDQIRNGTHGGYHVLQDGLFDKTGRNDRFITGMQKLGYVGLEYQGGIRVGDYNRGGGGHLHRAYVFWDTATLARFRTTDDQPQNDFEHDPKATERQSFSRLYRPPSR